MRSASNRKEKSTMKMGGGDKESSAIPTNYIEKHNAAWYSVVI